MYVVTISIAGTCGCKRGEKKMTIQDAEESATGMLMQSLDEK